MASLQGYILLGLRGMAAWEKIKNEDLRGKNEKVGRKTEENYIKNGGRDLKNASFWTINTKKIRKLSKCTI